MHRRIIVFNTASPIGGDLRSSEVAMVARPWDLHRTSQSAHALASVATSGFEVVERGLHLFGSEAMLGNGFDVTPEGSLPQEQPVLRRRVAELRRSWVPQAQETRSER